MFPSLSIGPEKWELYHMSEDGTELDDLAIT
jgi:hypothetical protein